MQVKIGEKIKELRKRDGRTQEEIASSLGVTSQAVSRWEANGGYPDMEIMPNIASLFGVSIDALFGYDGVDRKNRLPDNPHHTALHIHPIHLPYTPQTLHLLSVVCSNIGSGAVEVRFF